MVKNTFKCILNVVFSHPPLIYKIELLKIFIYLTVKKENTVNVTNVLFLPLKLTATLNLKKKTVETCPALVRTVVNYGIKYCSSFFKPKNYLDSSLWYLLVLIPCMDKFNQEIFSIYPQRNWVFALKSSFLIPAFATRKCKFLIF